MPSKINMRKSLIFLPAALVLAACASAPNATLNVSTPSGRPEAIFLTPDTAEAAGMISSGCMSAGMSVVSNSGYQVVCESNLTVGQQVLTQVLIGNSYSTTPEQFVQFNLADIGENVRVQATSWVETQMPFGQVRKVQTDETIAQRNALQQMLFAVGGVPASGSVDSSGKPRIGVGVVQFSENGSFGGREALYISTLNPGGPADAAGLMVCDRIVSVGGNSIKNVAGLVLETTRVAPGSPVEIDILRGTSELSFSVTPTTNALRLDPSNFASAKAIESQGCEPSGPAF